MQFEHKICQESPDDDRKYVYLKEVNNTNLKHKKNQEQSGTKVNFIYII